MFCTTSQSARLQLNIIFALLLKFSIGQYLVEVLEPSSAGNHRPVYRCDATGANFGLDVLAFTFRVTSVGCALPTSPENACGNVTFPRLNETECTNYFAVVPRGNCSFSEKAYNVQQAHPIGYGALIVFNDPGKEPVPMSGSEMADQVSIPVVMVDYDCMDAILNRYILNHGYVVTIKVTPGYYDLIKYLVPFGAVISFCLIVLFISLIIRVCRERRRLARKRLSKSNLKKLPLIKYRKGTGMYETCAVCLDDFEEGEKLRQLPCKHAYHTKCIDPWLTKNRKVCPVCKRKVGPSNGSDSSDSDSERSPPTPTSSMSQPSAIVSTSNQTTRDSVPLLRYEQPMATSHNLNSLRTEVNVNVTRVRPPGIFARASGVASAAAASSSAPIIRQPRGSVEEPPTPDELEPHSEQQQPDGEQGRRALPRFLGRLRNFMRRVAGTEYNPHTIFDNDVTSVSEEDQESQANGVILQQPTASANTLPHRSVILEPLPPTTRDPILPAGAGNSA